MCFRRCVPVVSRETTGTVPDCQTANQGYVTVAFVVRIQYTKKYVCLKRLPLEIFTGGNLWAHN